MAKSIRSASGKGKVKPTLKGKLAEPSKASVKVLPKKTAPKSGIENRGTKPTSTQRTMRARDYEFNKLEKSWEQRFDTYAGGPRAGEKNTAGPGRANARKAAAVSKEARKNVPIELNSLRPWVNKGADPLKNNNPRALKAANKPTKPRGGMRGGGLGGLNKANR